MTVKQYITGKFLSFGVQISEADLFDICLISQTAEEDEMNQNIHDSISRGICKIIPSLLLRPSISEGGVSISKVQKADIEAYYEYECKRLCIQNTLPKPTVEFL